MIKTLLKSVRQYKKYAILTPIFVALEVVLECLIPLIMASLIDEMSSETMMPVIKYGSILLIMAALSLYFGMTSGKTAALASTGFAGNLRQDLYFAVQNFSFPDIDKFSSSSLVTRLTTDVTNTQQAFQMCTRIAVRVPLMLIFSFIMSFRLSSRLSLIFLVAVPILGIALFLIMRIVMPLFRRIFKNYDALNNSVQENVSGIRVVKSFVREDYETDKFKKASENVCKDFTGAEKILALNNPIMMFCVYGVMLFISYFGARLIVNSGATEFTTGSLSALIGYSTQILMSMMMLSMVFVMISMSAESAKRISEVLTQKPSLVDGESEENVSDGSIEFKDVCFEYSEKAERFALEDINLKIKSGETIGIIGGTGSSKSTLVQLIPRLYDVTAGEVLVGGKDVREYKLDILRDAVSMVLQKNVLFSGTIKDNLKWGDKEASDEEIVRVCKLACADGFIDEMPDKYDTFIEQGGTNVSGGQKQRLCIARALLKKPKIIIFDDSTSAVDTRTDALIRKALNEEIPDTTKLIIAQRIASVMESDKILILDGGKVVGFGNHEELMANNSIYREIYFSQTGMKEESETIKEGGIN